MNAERPDETTRSIHDNHVLGYSVDAERRSIVLHTEFRYGSAPFERTDVRFEGVLGYHFQDSLGGILFDVERVDMAELVGCHADLFRAGAPYGWPFLACPDDPVAFVASAGASAFRIDGSVGFQGFVVCTSMELEVADGEDSPARPRS